MGWFDQQLRERMRHDDEAFQRALTGMADAVLGEHHENMFQKDREQTASAIIELLDYYHVKAQDLPDEIVGIHDQLEYLLRPTGIMRRTVRLTGTWYRDALSPMIGTLKENGKAVTLLPGQISGYTYRDPETGKKIRVNKKRAKLLEEEAFCFYRPLPLKEIGIGDLLHFMIRCLSLSDILMILLAVFAAALAGMILPWLNKAIYGSVLENGSVQLLVSIIVFMLCTTITMLLLDMIKTILTARISTKLDVQVNAACMMRVLSLPPTFFREYASGNISNRLDQIASLCKLITDTLLGVGLTSLFSLIYITQLVQFAPGVVIPGLLVIAVSVIVSAATNLMQIRLIKKQMEVTAEESGLDYALIAGVQKIRLAGAEKRVFAKWAKIYSQSARLTYDPPAFLKISNVITTSISLMGTIVIYYFTIQTKVPFRDYFAFNCAYGTVVGAFSSLMGTLYSFARVKPMLEMAEPILKAVPEVAENKKIVTRLSGAIELNNISFRYRENFPWVLKDFSLKIKPGQYVAVVGETGCGKTTLMRLLLGFEKPQKGGVYYDDKPLDSLDLRSVRRNIGTVMQDGKLFTGDIYSNIVITAPWLKQEDAWRAAELAGIAEDIRNMPMGMYTMVSEGSGNISGGQKQRLMIARAIAPAPKILMLDEATSALDNRTQKKVSESLDTLKCTRIVIAHRLSTIRRCDRILVLDRGRIVGDGTYEELLKTNHFFSELVSRQRLSLETSPAADT